jgi:adenine C2-methylase RlmN of 23S rRNA A2503 and tRNA A37
MTRTTWNARDTPKAALEELLKRKYKEIDNEYKMLRKVEKKEDAKKLIEEIWQMKDFANSIEIELMRREYNNGPAS